MTSTMASDLCTGPKLRRHSKYWLDDGSLILQTHDSNLYKVHRTLLDRHSRLLATLHQSEGLEKERNLVDGLVVLRIPEELEVGSGDLEVLLEHLYHDV